MTNLGERAQDVAGIQSRVELASLDECVGARCRSATACCPVGREGHEGREVEKSLPEVSVPSAWVRQRLRERFRGTPPS